MKREYFTAGTIEEKTAEMLARIERVVGRHDPAFFPDKSALIIIDMQKYFLEKDSHAFIPSAAAIIPGLKKLTLTFKSIKRPVIMTKHIDSSDPIVPMRRWWKKGVEKDSPVSELSDDFIDLDSKVIEKSTYDAFNGTPLDDFLRGNDVSQVVICGVMTHLCCETTARSAFMRGYDVFFTIDGTATYDEDFHISTLLNLSHGFAVPVKVDELLHGLKSTDEN